LSRGIAAISSFSLSQAGCTYYIKEISFSVYLFITGLVIN